MVCRFVFGVWWSILVWAIWAHIRPQELHIWTVDRHATPTIVVKRVFSPIQFENASILSLNSTLDRVSLDLTHTTDASMGHVSIDKAYMHVYDTPERTSRRETYTVALQTGILSDMHLAILQDDTHYSPFRRIVIEPKINWTLGGDPLENDERVGFFKEGRWLEGTDPTQLFSAVLFAWCVGVVFLVVTRRHSDTTRQKRVYKNMIF